MNVLRQRPCWRKRREVFLFIVAGRFRYVDKADAHER